MRNFTALSDHIIVNVKDGIWSAKVMLQGYVFLFEEDRGEAKLTTGPIPTIDFGPKRTKIIHKAIDNARAEFARRDTSRHP